MKSSSKLHPRNKNINGYDFDALVKALPAIESFLLTTKAGTTSIDFANAEGVKLLNKALLIYQYGIREWDIPQGFLCPPIPGRADYIHHLADLLAEQNAGRIPTVHEVKILDIGTGANCIYPLIGVNEYGWKFVGVDINDIALNNAQKIITNNKLTDKIEIRKQTDRNNYFSGVIKKEEYFDAVMCNPPFHSSPQEANESNMKKVQNLSKNKSNNPSLNFGGQNAELWTRGGEERFIKKMIIESINFKNQVGWFTSLVSKSETLKSIYHELNLQNITNHKTIEMAQGNKINRFVAWKF